MRRYMPVILCTDAPSLLISLSVLLATFVGGLVFYLVRLPTQLQSKVDQAIAERKQSDERFRDFAGSASDWFGEMRPDLCFTYISGRLTEVTGHKPEDRIGIRRTDLGCPDDLASIRKNWKSTLKI
jgi:PAS domain-containing protein